MKWVNVTFISKQLVLFLKLFFVSFQIKQFWQWLIIRQGTWRTPCKTFPNLLILNGFHCQNISLTLSWWKFLSHRNQFIDLLCILINWFLYDRDLRHEIINNINFLIANSSYPLEKSFQLFQFHANLTSENSELPGLRTFPLQSPGF